MRDFDYLLPSTLKDAVQMRIDQGEEACLFAGGTALLLAMRQRLLSPTALISLANIIELQGITFDSKNGLRIGALTRHSDIAKSKIVATHYPMLARMAARVANPQVRNQGTIGGNLCYADPATDPPGALMALGAIIVLVGENGERALPIEEFISGYYSTALEASEILKEIRIPPLPNGVTGHYVRHLRTAAEHRPVANFAFLVRKNHAICADARIVVGAATAVPTLAVRASDFLKGQKITHEVVAEAGRRIAEEITPISDLRGNGDFRRGIVEVIARRGIAEAFGLDWKEAWA